MWACNCLLGHVSWDRERVSLLWDKMRSILKQRRAKMKQKMVGLMVGRKRERERMTLFEPLGPAVPKVTLEVLRANRFIYLPLKLG